MIRTSIAATGLFVAGLSIITPALAEILDSGTPQLRVRAGSNVTGQVSTVEYNPGIPTELDTLAGAVAEPETISTNAVAGGSGVYTIRFVTDVNAREHRNANIETNIPLTGNFYYDSSAPMSCITPASCGAHTIPFSKIKWNILDGDTLNSVSQYDDTASQLFQVQTDTDGRQNREDTRHRNHYQYIYINDILRPAGTYSGEVTISGVAN